MPGFLEIHGEIGADHACHRLGIYMRLLSDSVVYHGYRSCAFLNVVRHRVDLARSESVLRMVIRLTVRGTLRNTIRRCVHYSGYERPRADYETIQV